MIIVLALIMGLAGWWFGSGRMTDVPVVQGLDRAAAEAALDTAGVGMEIRGIYSDDAAAETVLGTDPDGGSRVARGDTVALLVSLGAPTVPGLGGGDRASIEAELRQRTFEPVDGGTAFSSSVPEGGVAALEPAPGTTLPTGSAVSVVLSKGPAPIDMPDLVGRTVDDARKIVEDAGLTVVEVREVFDPEVDGGRVSATDPAAGTETGAGGTVTLTVSTAVKVPSFLGRSVGSARTELDRLGLDIEVRQVADTDRSLVVGQNPAPGERAEPGGTIVLTALP